MWTKFGYRQHRKANKPSFPCNLDMGNQPKSLLFGQNWHKCQKNVKNMWKNGNFYMILQMHSMEVSLNYCIILILNVNIDFCDLQGVCLKDIIVHSAKHWPIWSVWQPFWNNRLNCWYSSKIPKWHYPCYRCHRKANKNCFPYNLSFWVQPKLCNAK